MTAADHLHLANQLGEAGQSIVRREGRVADHNAILQNAGEKSTLLLKQVEASEGELAKLRDEQLNRADALQAGCANL